MDWILAFKLIGLILLIIVICWSPVIGVHWFLFRSPGNRNKAVMLPDGGVEFSAGRWSLLIATILALYALISMTRHLVRHHATWSEFASNGIGLAAAFLLIYELPGTIVVNDIGIEQRFWIRPNRLIRWNEIEEINTGDRIRIVTVTSSDGTEIVFSKGHADRPRLLREIKQHCGQNFPADFPVE
jgi:hypothetical protein